MADEDLSLLQQRLHQGGQQSQPLLLASPTSSASFAATNEVADESATPLPLPPSSPLSSGRGTLAYSSLSAAASDDPLVMGSVPEVPELQDWRQSETLQPPPYPEHWRMREMLPGLALGECEIQLATSSSGPFVFFCGICCLFAEADATFWRWVARSWMEKKWDVSS